MRFHVLACPHTVTHKDYVACAFTQKVLKFCAMMTRRGHNVIHYGHEHSVVECAEHVTVTTRDLLLKVYGDYDWKEQFFKFDFNDLVFRTFNENCIKEIALRKQGGDFVLCFFNQYEVAQHFSDLICVHPGIGTHEKTPKFRFSVFESYAVMNNTIGFQDPKWYHVVIPNYFDPLDFEYRPQKMNYLLFLGRITRKKGISLAEDVALRTGHQLIVAGQGNYKDATGKDNPPSCITFFGYADADQRRALLANAKALLVPTFYSEPFGGVVIEAGFSGTPVITTDWGAFPEIVQHGKTGFRCRAMEEWVYAVKNIHKIKPEKCREWALNNFSMSRIAEMYEHYFQMLTSLTQNGFYTSKPERSELDWLTQAS